MGKALAFDIGGTKICYAIIDEKGTVCSEIFKVNTPKKIEEFEKFLSETFSKFEQEVDVFAISTAGAVNNENTGIISSTGNMCEGYNKIDFQSYTNAYKIHEQRVGMEHRRTVFGVKLRADIPAMRRHLDNLHKVGIGVCANALHTILLEVGTVGVVELIAVAVALFNYEL